MVKEISRTTWLIIIGIFLCLTLVIGTTTKVVQSMTYKKEIAVEINSKQIDTGIRIDKESKSANTFTSYRTVPTTSIETIDVPIFQWAKEQEDAFFDEMRKTEENLNQKFVAHFNLDTNITKITDELFSIEMKAEQAVEQSMEYSTMKTFIVDLKKEKIINPTDIFDENKFTLQDRFQLVQNQIDKEKKKFVAHFNLDTNITKITDELFSIEMKAEQAVEQSMEYSTMKTFIVDLKKEKIINPTDIFDENKFTLQDRFQLVQNQIDKEIDPNTWEPALERLQELEVSLHSDEMTFYFNDIDLRENGDVLEVKIPMIELADYLSDDYYNVFITEELQAELEQNKIEEEQARIEAKENHKYIALTLDDGPGPETTTSILDTLKQYDAKATFFMLGNSVEQYPEIAKQVADEGHEIANHSVTHANLNAVNTDRIRQEMTESTQKIEQATGEKPLLFRPPYGNLNETVVSIAQEVNQTIILWSLDTNDWEHRNANATIELAINDAELGSIILMHDLHQTPADALPQIMQRLSSEGYEFVTVSELLPYLDEQGIGPYRGNQSLKQ